MTTRMFGMLIFLAALWGASFLFIRIGAGPFGPVPLMAMRVTIAAACLIAFMLVKQRTRRAAAPSIGRSDGPLAESQAAPVLPIVPPMPLGSAARQAGPSGFAAMRGHWPALIVVGLLNQALPFCLFAYAELTLSAGVTSVINATTPLWAALVAFVWLGDRLGRLRAVGMLLGLAGVVVLVWPDLTGAMGQASNPLAPLAVLAATLCYGIAANFTKRHLTGVDSLAVASGSMLVAAIALLPLAWLWWPLAPIPPEAWIAVALLGLFCTAFAYGLYFALIASAGPARAVSVTFLIPVFGLLWGAIFLKEALTSLTLLGTGIVLVGTILASGMGGKRPLQPARSVSVRG
ncbi:DMT family transporter [Robbsia andropogonis]|uniref:DMT family transporter n=1 Tax=Robbsia andropogonis TaxID=28092 RepID=UPI000466395B